MSMREMDRLKVIEAVVEQRLMPWRAAERLGVSRRQIERLTDRYRNEGAVGLISRQRGKPSHNRLPRGVADRALNLIGERYADFGPTLACEKLWECHGIHLAKETVRKLMTDAGLWIPRRQRPPKIYQPRARRACFGELIQIDGSEHAWFELSCNVPPFDEWIRQRACSIMSFAPSATMNRCSCGPLQTSLGRFAQCQFKAEINGFPNDVSAPAGLRICA